MVFGFFGKKGNDAPADDEEEEVELVSFKGATNGNPVDMKAHAKLLQVALEPAREMVTDGLVRRAETIRVDLKGEKGQVVLMVDGMPYSGGRLSKPQVQGITQVLKLLAGLDPKLRSKPQRGGLKAEFQTLPYELTIVTTPQADGAERLVVNSRNTKEKRDTIEDLGYPASVKQLIREVTGKKRGIVLVTGPASSGVTTLTYALLRGLDVYLSNIFSIADLQGRELINITKFEKNPEDDLEATIRRIIRAEGDVVFVDPLTSHEQVAELGEVAEQICLYTEIAGRDAVGGLQEFVKLMADSAKASKLVDAIFSQKLIRLLCADCREAFRPNPKLLAKMGMPPETKVLYKKGEPAVDEKTGEQAPPCEKCGGIGYFGRTGMLEYIVVSDALRALIAEGAPPEKLREQARADGAQSLKKDGMRLVLEGKTSLEELQRVFSPT